MSKKLERQDEHGRFLPGKTAVESGIHPQSRAHRWVTLMSEAVTDKDIITIVEKAVKQAKAGNRFAREFLWNYGVGKPLQMVEFKGNAPFMQLIAQYVKLAEDEEEESEEE
jgi:hypothetical protein